MQRSPKPTTAKSASSKGAPAASAAAPAMTASKYDELLRSIYYSVGDEGLFRMRTKLLRKRNPKSL